MTAFENRAKHPGGRPHKEIDLDELKRLLDEDHSLRQIAVRLRCGYGTVYRAAKVLRYGMVSRATKALRQAASDPKLSNVIQNPKT